MKNDKQQAVAAAAFAERWKDHGYERGESQLFWADLLTNVYGVEDLPSFIRYEEQVSSMVDSTNFIDGHIPSTKVLIEQKSLGKDLRAPIPQSDGGKLNPFQQAKKYVANMPLSQHPRWIVTCNFAEFLVYDMEQPNGEPEQIFLKDLGKEYYRLQFLVDVKSEHLSKEMQVSMKAGEIVGRIYDALLKQYDDNSPVALRWLNILCVRIVFCLYAEDAGVFRHDQFHDFLAAYDARDMRRALADLFVVLNTPIEKRSRYITDDLSAFPYTNGGLFEEEIEIPQFTEELKQTLLQNASLDFDWSEISPTIFGAVFESTLNPETRRSGGMHYTSIENIHKVIDPLFLNDLRGELDKILEEKVEKTRIRRLDEYQDKLASLTFLDPACGSGNFLTETFLSLRRLENEVIRERYHGQITLGGIINPIKVNIHQFYGIEINDFAVTVATTALWISEAQMLNETERIIQHDIDFLPLKSYANIKEGNALRVPWDEWEIDDKHPSIVANQVFVYVQKESNTPIASDTQATYDTVDVYAKKAITESGPKEKQTRKVQFDYIFGNPPFIGHQNRSKAQQEDFDLVFQGMNNYGKLDYVCAWYFVASRLMIGTNIRAAFVSTNSITQGESVAVMWKPLFEQGMTINYAVPNFPWTSESNDMATVHCDIIGFSMFNPINEKKYLFVGTGKTEVSHINGYLMDAPDVFIQARGSLLTAGLPPMTKGSQPTDGGYFFLTEAQRDELLSSHPEAEPLVRQFVGADEFINNRRRYCLWLKGVPPTNYRHIKFITDRLHAIRDMRLSSPTASVRRDADTPMLFTQIRQPEGHYIIVPRHSSENRRYIPMGFMSPNVICGDANQMIPNATVYLFGVLISNVHMAWMRIVCGRLEMRYRYSPAVYNNFPWPKPTKEQKERIERTAQAILDARSLYSNSSLADLYDELTMPPELRKAHQENDRAVMAAYGFNIKMTESQCVSELFKMYQAMTKQHPLH